MARGAVGTPGSPPYGTPAFPQTIINVVNYGALGDGAHDDTEAIQGAIDAAAGNAVYFPPGNYSVASSLTTPSDVLMFGAPGASRITFAGNGESDNVRLKIDGVSDVHLRDLIFSESDVSGRTGNYGTISSDGSSRITIENVEVDSGSSTGVHCINSTDISVLGGRYHGVQADGLHFQRGCRRVTVIGARVYGCADDCIGFVSHGYDVYGYVRDLIVANCTLEDTTAGDPGSGVAFIGGIGGIIHHNIIRATALAGVRVTPYFDASEGDAVVANLIVDANLIEDVGNYSGATPGVVKDGVYVTDARNVHITRNLIRRPVSGGIVLSGAAIDCSITDNNVSEAGERGIWVPGARRTGSYLNLWTDALLDDGRSLAYVAHHGVRVESNNVVSPGDDGIYLQGVSNAYSEDVDVIENRVREANASADGTKFGVFIRYTKSGRLLRNVVAGKSGSSFTSYSLGDNLDLLREGNRPTPTWEPVNIFGKRIVYGDPSSAPSSGTWELADEFRSWNPQSGTAFARVCSVAGTNGTLNGGATTGSITSGSSELTVSSITGLTSGGYITIAGVSGRKKITDIEGTVVTLNSAADATVSGAAVAYAAASFVSTPNLV